MSLGFKRLITKIRCNGWTAYQNVCVISEYLQPTSYFQAATRLPLNFQESLLFVLIPSQLSPSPFNNPKYWCAVTRSGSPQTLFSFTLLHLQTLPIELLQTKLRFPSQTTVIILCKFIVVPTKSRLVSSENCQHLDCRISASVFLSSHIWVNTSFIHSFIHSFSILSDDRSKASSKTIPPHSAIQSFLLQMRVSSPVLKVIQ